MKDRILLFIIGLLLGAVIATGTFFVYTKATTTCNNSNNTQAQMPGGAPTSMGSSENSQGQPPEKPSNENNQNNTQENNQQSNSQTNSN